VGTWASNRVYPFQFQIQTRSAQLGTYIIGHPNIFLPNSLEGCS